MEKIILTVMCMIYNEKSEEVLMINRLNDWPGFTFPGGHVEKDEPIVEAVIREIKEETNLDGAVGDFYEAIQDDYVHKRTVQVVMYLKNITGDVSISDEHDNWMWANLEKIKTLELSTAFEKVLKKKNWKI